MKSNSKEDLRKLQSIKQSITAHPDCIEGTEFADMVGLLCEVVESITMNRINEIQKQLRKLEREGKNTPLEEELRKEWNELFMPIARKANDELGKLLDF